jgi:hypothetical protein
MSIFVIRKTSIRLGEIDMSTARKLIGVAACAVALTASVGVANASTINILWYAGGVNVLSSPAGTYENDINALIAQAASAPISVHNTWNITFWNSGPMPAGTFNVLVTASPEGGWSSSPSYGALDAAVTASSFGNRVMVTGQDADWHYTNSPGPSTFNNPQGFLIDSINWAGSGSGMGAVFLGTDPLNIGVTGFTGLGAVSSTPGDTVDIPAAYASFPINEGLSSAGLSNWFSSAHDFWTGTDSTKWTGINIDANGNFITIVSAGTAGGSTGVPEPASLALMGIGVAAILGRRKSLK